MLSFLQNDLLCYQTHSNGILCHAQEPSKGEFSSKFLRFRIRSINGLISKITPEKENIAPAM